MNFAKKAVRAFGLFWWNFLVGDTPELFVAVLVILGILAIFHTSHTLIYVLPVLVIGSLVASVTRAIRKR